jgi:hypothetical protein
MRLKELTPMPCHLKKTTQSAWTLIACQFYERRSAALMKKQKLICWLRRLALQKKTERVLL